MGNRQRGQSDQYEPGQLRQAEFLHDAIRYAYDRDVVLDRRYGNDNTISRGIRLPTRKCLPLRPTMPNGNAPYSPISAIMSM